MITSVFGPQTPTSYHIFRGPEGDAVLDADRSGAASDGDAYVSLTVASRSREQEQYLGFDELKRTVEALGGRGVSGEALTQELGKSMECGQAVGISVVNMPLCMDILSTFGCSLMFESTADGLTLTLSPQKS